MAIPKRDPLVLESPEQTFERWLRDGQTWIGIFENQDLGHRDVGRRIARPFDVVQKEAGKLGETRATDHPTIGLGWRYVLVAKVDTAGDALAWLEQREHEVKRA